MMVVWTVADRLVIARKSRKRVRKRERALSGYCVALFSGAHAPAASVDVVEVVVEIVAGME